MVVWIHSSSMYYQFNLLRSRAHSIFSVFHILISGFCFLFSFHCVTIFCFLVWIHSSSMYHQFNLLRSRAHSIWMRRSFCSLVEIPAPPISNLQNTNLLQVFWFTQNFMGFVFQAQFEDEFLASSSWPAWNKWFRGKVGNKKITHKLPWTHMNYHFKPVTVIRVIVFHY